MLKFVVVGRELARDLRGREARRIKLAGLPADGFGDVPAPDAVITMVVTPEEAKRFDLGDEFTIRELAGG